jgi:maltokinase
MNPLTHVKLPFAEWLPKQRWYAGRSRVLVSADAVTITPLRDDLDLMLLDATYAEGSPERYQVIVKWEPVTDSVAGTDADTRYGDRATIGVADGRVGYDALYDPSAAAFLLSLCQDAGERGAVSFTKEPGDALPVGEPARVSSAEQSNTSVVFGQQAIMKAFRRVSPGINTDIELNRVLGRAGNENVARLLATFDTTWDGQPCPLGMVTEFAAGSKEGWAMATALAADSFADFSAESRRLGAAVASVHASLADALGTSSGEFPVATAVARLRSAAAVVPEVAHLEPAIEERIVALYGESLTLQRVHGDLHLGQVLRAEQRWLVIDFEGEPGAATDERRAPDSSLRDVAGMLRSYEYAAYAAHAPGDTADSDTAAAAQDWIDRNRDAFCAGYAEVAGFDPRDFADVLAAYELDKAVYEAAYEARFRPDWLSIPLRSITRLLG